MPAAHLPDNEHDRLAELSRLRILDTQRTVDFDIFPDLAATLFSVPIASITLIDHDRQWSKASIGLDFAETPREVSFCAHTILNPSGILVVPDATKDPRFADNPFVLGGPKIRFYAGSPIFGPNGHVLGALCIAAYEPREISEETLQPLKQLALAVSGAFKLYGSVQKQLKLAVLDPLTGLGNRQGLDEILIEQMRQQSVSEVYHTALLLLDIDNFGTVNDLFGHTGGDDALREIAARLMKVIRTADALGRLGEDKFFVLVKGNPSNEVLLAIGERIHSAFIEPFIVRHQPVPLRTSIGIAVSSKQIASPEALLQKADMAVLEAKRSGGGTTWLEDEGISPATVEVGRQTMASLLRDALIPAGHEPFALAFQPIFAAASGRLVGFEALVRWPQPDGRMRPPSEFIPTAEATGLVVQLDRWVLDRACQIAATWPDHLTISSNLSAANFYAVGLVEEVKQTLCRHKLAPDRLKLEITETVLLRDPARVRETIAELRKNGTHIVLDDFGSGHASLAYLRDYTFDGLKIDASFTAEIEVSSKGRAFLRAINGMVEALGIDSTAEGIETVGQLSQIRDGNVKYVQGFLLGRPMTPEDALDLIRAQQNTAFPQTAAA